MQLIEIVLMAVALSIDALVCAIIYGEKPFSREVRYFYTLVLAGSFGLFQFAMPVIGYAAGFQLQKYFAAYDHWVAFGLLFAVSINMLREAFFGSEDEKSRPRLGFFTIIALSIATSIDALAVGVSLGLIHENIWLFSIIVGIICFSISACGFLVGQALSRFLNLDKLLTVVGALVLIGIGVKVLYDHKALFF